MSLHRLLDATVIQAFVSAHFMPIAVPLCDSALSEALVIRAGPMAHHLFFIQVCTLKAEAQQEGLALLTHELRCFRDSTSWSAWPVSLT